MSCFFLITLYKKVGESCFFFEQTRRSDVLVYACKEVMDVGYIHPFMDNMQGYKSACYPLQSYNFCTQNS